MLRHKLRLRHNQCQDSEESTTPGFTASDGKHPRYNVKDITELRKEDF